MYLLLFLQLVLTAPSLSPYRPGDSEVVAFVRGNNIHLSQNGTVTQITHDGGPDMFHGVPDWVYEEEVFGDTNTMWFSPDGAVLAFLSFNETGVGNYRIPYYSKRDHHHPRTHTVNTMTNPAHCRQWTTRSSPRATPGSWICAIPRSARPIPPWRSACCLWTRPKCCRCPSTPSSPRTWSSA